jgi:hypothetical protein
MPMNTTRLRDNLFNRLFTGVTLDPADETKVKASLLIWAEEIIAEVGRAQIEFQTGDLGVGPGTFEDDQNNPITGEGETLAGTIDGRIT